jgi:glycosyltransferase involved in cell wall biosynthesis
VKLENPAAKAASTATPPAHGQSLPPAHGLSLPPHRLSLVVPVFDEQDNLAPLVDQVHAALASYPYPWELLLVDDGSDDDTRIAIEQSRARHGPHVRLIALARRFRQTAAMQAGIDAARGDVIVTLDGDLQNDPRDIAPMVERLLRDDLDLVAGWRQDRHDSLARRLPSWLANRLIGHVTGVRLHDYGCTLKAFRARALKQVRLYGDMHRFIPAWMATVTTRQRIVEQVVTHHPRRSGQSKYGIGRTFRVLLDLLSVHFFLRYSTRPGHFFGAIGLALGAIGGAILVYLAGVKFLLDESIGTRPLLLVGFFMVIAGLQMISTGVLAELLARVYLSSEGAHPYLALPDRPLADDSGWKQPSHDHDVR